MVRRWLGLGRDQAAAVAVLLALPPPLPIFVPAEEREALEYTVSTLALSTVVSLLAVAAVALVFPPERAGRNRLPGGGVVADSSPPP